MGSFREGKVLRREESSPNPVPGWAAVPETGPPAFTIDGVDEDGRLRSAGSLTRQEVLGRRSRRLNQLARFYRRQYWALMEEVRVKHRDFYWEYGVSPFEEDDEEEEDGGGIGCAVEENDGCSVVGGLDGVEECDRARIGVRLGFGEGHGSAVRREERQRCAFPGCKSKAMPLTRFCHPHIISDRKQTLYKACAYVTKSCGQSGPITCGKPILRTVVPSLCHMHLQKAQRSISQALRRVGINISSSGKPTQTFGALIAEFVCGIQAQRTEAMNSSAIEVMDQMDEDISAQAAT